MKVFYARVSTIEQNEDRQIQSAHEIGADKIFLDKATGSNADRKELKNMINFVREGDQVIVSDISRIARNTKDLLMIIEQLKNKGVQFRSLKESIDTSTPTGEFMLSVFGALYQLELSNIHTRQAEGIAIAKSQGKYKGRSKIKIDEQRFRSLCADWKEGKRSAVSIQKELDISPQTFYRRVKELNI